MNWWQSFYSDSDFIPAVNFPTPEESEAEGRFLDRILWPRGARRILDLGCGYGRHAIPLARMGYQMVGLDFSALYLARAAQEAKAAGLPLYLVQADMRALPLAPGSFGAAICMLTTFGFFPTREEDRAVVAGVYDLLAPGGLFLLDVDNPQFLAHFFTDGEHHWAIPLDGGIHLENHYYLEENASKVRLHSLLLRDDQVWKESGFAIHLYSYGELIAIFQDTGFRVAGAWGDYAGSSFAPSSPRVILLGARA